MATTPLSHGFERFLFRRQFVLGPRRVSIGSHWSSIPLSRTLHLSVHEDLPASVRTRGDHTVVLMGIAIDPEHPGRNESEILEALVERAGDLRALIDATAPLVGRWVIVYHDGTSTCLFTDPLGFRTVFYFADGEHTWCGSQPELIRTACEMTFSADEPLLRFLADPDFARMESAWIGARTIYDGCFQLLPNHYLTLEPLGSVRFYPTRPIPVRPLPDVVEAAVPLLRGIMTTIAARGPARLPLTAGVDSRVLLAASRQVAGSLQYFVDRMGVLDPEHPDVWVPSELARRLELEFVVDNSTADPPGWFVALLARNVTGARVLPKTRSIHRKLMAGEQRLNLNGNGGEVCRSWYDKPGTRDPGRLASEDLVRRLGFRRAPGFAVQVIGDWRRELEPAMGDAFDLLDFLHWEQRLGRWGAQYPAEQDIAVDEISPFNCRLLMETLASAGRELRRGPGYPLHRELVRQMWPEALSLPVNPPPRGELIRAVNRSLRRHVPPPVVRALRKVLT